MVYKYLMANASKAFVVWFFIVFGVPVLASDIRIAFSKAENIELFAKNPDSKGQWCSSEIEVDLSSKNPQSDEKNPAVKDVVKRVGVAVIEPSCSAAYQLIVYQRSSGKRLGIANRANQWLLMPDVSRGATPKHAKVHELEIENNSIIQAVSDKASVYSIRHCKLSLNCYKTVVNIYGASVGNGISLIGRCAGGLLFFLAILSSPKRDRRFKTGYRDNRTAELSIFLAGVALILFLVCELIAFFTKNHTFVMVCILLLLIFIVFFLQLSRGLRCRKIPTP